jgi:hypothetical protein
VVAATPNGEDITTPNTIKHKECNAMIAVIGHKELELRLRLMEQIDEFVIEAIVDRLDAWELIDFIQAPIEDVLRAAISNEWINEENIEDLLDFVGLRKDNDTSYGK